jgi:hypothetical protein
MFSNSLPAQNSTLTGYQTPNEKSQKAKRKQVQAPNQPGAATTLASTPLESRAANAANLRTAIQGNMAAGAGADNAVARIRQNPVVGGNQMAGDRMSNLSPQGQMTQERGMMADQMGRIEQNAQQYRNPAGFSPMPGIVTRGNVTNVVGSPADSQLLDAAFARRQASLANHVMPTVGSNTAKYGLGGGADAMSVGDPAKHADYLARMKERRASVPEKRAAIAAQERDAQAQMVAEGGGAGMMEQMLRNPRFAALMDSNPQAAIGMLGAVASRDSSRDQTRVGMAGVDADKFRTQTTADTTKEGFNVEKDINKDRLKSNENIVATTETGLNTRAAGANATTLAVTDKTIEAQKSMTEAQIAATDALADKNIKARAEEQGRDLTAEEAKQIREQTFLAEQGKLQREAQQAQLETSEAGATARNDSTNTANKEIAGLQDTGATTRMGMSTTSAERISSDNRASNESMNTKNIEAQQPLTDAQAKQMQSAAAKDDAEAQIMLDAIENKEQGSQVFQNEIAAGKRAEDLVRSARRDPALAKLYGLDFSVLDVVPANGPQTPQQAVTVAAPQGPQAATLRGALGSEQEMIAPIPNRYQGMSSGEVRSEELPAVSESVNAMFGENASSMTYPQIMETIATDIENGMTYGPREMQTLLDFIYARNAADGGQYLRAMGDYQIPELRAGQPVSMAQLFERLNTGPTERTNRRIRSWSAMPTP